MKKLYILEDNEYLEDGCIWRKGLNGENIFFCKIPNNENVIIQTKGK